MPLAVCLDFNKTFYSFLIPLKICVISGSSGFAVGRANLPISVLKEGGVQWYATGLCA